MELLLVKQVFTFMNNRSFVQGLERSLVQTEATEAKATATLYLYEHLKMVSLPEIFSFQLLEKYKFIRKINFTAVFWKTLISGVGEV